MKVSNLDIPTSWLPLIEKIFRWYDNQMYPVWCRKWLQTSRRQKATKKSNSVLSQVSDIWNGLANQADWEAAAVISETTGFKLFTLDQSYRIKNGLVGSATPSLTHQFTVRKIDVMDNTTDELTAVYRRRRVAHLPALVDCSIKVVRTSGAGTAVLSVMLETSVKGSKVWTIERMAEISGNQDWTTYYKNIYAWCTEAIRSIAIVVSFEDRFEGYVLLDNTRIIQDTEDKYTGWRQNAGTDNWIEVFGGALVTQNIVYPENI